LAREKFKCLYIPDLFHALNEIVKALGISFYQKYTKAKNQKKKAAESFSKIERSIRIPSESTDKIIKEKRSIVQELEKQCETIKDGREQYLNYLHHISMTVHPFSTDDSSKQTSQRVLEKLQQIFKKLTELKNTFQIKDASDHLGKFKKQIKDIVAVVDYWWLEVQQSLLLEHLDAKKYQWLCFLLLPYFYWNYQAQRTDNSEIRETYRTLANKAKESLLTDSYTRTLSKDELYGWEKWAEDKVKNFQRASSAVEGRNGYLSQVYQTRRGVSTQRLLVLTVIHNFWLKRPDGTTAAQRLFGIDFADLFEYLLKTSDPLPMSRISRARASPGSSKLLNFLFN